MIYKKISPSEFWSRVPRYGMWDQWYQRQAPVDLRGHDLSGYDLSDRSFTGVDLSYCDLRGADLRRCDFRKARIDGCDFTGAQVARCLGEGREIHNDRIHGHLVALCGEQLAIGDEQHEVSHWVTRRRDLKGYAELIAWLGRFPPYSVKPRAALLVPGDE